MTDEKWADIATAVAKYGLLLMIMAGLAHAGFVLVTGIYEFTDYGVRARLIGWDARIAASLEAALLLFAARAVWKLRLNVTP